MSDPLSAPERATREEETIPLSSNVPRSDEAPPTSTPSVPLVVDEEKGIVTTGDATSTEGLTHASYWIDYRPKSSVTIFGVEIPLPYIAPPEFYFMLNRRQRIAFMVFVGFVVACFLTAFISIIVAIVKAAHRPKVTCKFTKYRLPDWYVPTQYDLTLDVMMDPPPAFVGGEVVARLNMTALGRAQSCIVLHSDDMQIYGTEASLDGGKTWQATVFRQNYNQQLIVQLVKGKFNASQVLLRVAFGYPMSAWLDGFYRTVYTTASGYDSAFGFTQLEPLSARRAFPSFDEPQLKARLNLTLITPPGYLALSNMPVLKQEEVYMGYYGAKAMSYTFQTSPPMSTYTMGWLVAPQDDMISINASLPHPDPSKPNRTVTVWATNNQEAASLQISLDATLKIVPMFEQLFGVPYALPKMDLIAVPDKNEAMENWGILAFKESEIILTKSYTEQDRKDVILTIAHEIAHQWFGNLVTFEWWDALWLAEGLAQYWQHVAISAVAPEFNLPNAFYVDSTAEALYEDTSIRTSHPLTIPSTIQLDNELEIDSLFDVIAYQKGAAIVNFLRMAVAATEGNFNLSHTAVQGKVVQALSKMLQERAYSTVNTVQFLQYIGEVVSEDFLPSASADSWFYRYGYPVVSVTDFGNGTYDLAQQPFALNTALNPPPQCTSTPNWLLGPDRGASQNLGRWAIPMTYTVAGDPDSVAVQTLATCSDRLELPQPAAFLKFNKNQDGYYRVNYPLSMWDSLIEATARAAPELSGGDVSGLMDDAFYLSWSDRIPMNVTLRLIEAMVKRTVATVGVPEYGPWSLALNLLARIEQFMDQYDSTLKDKKCYKAYTNWLNARVLSPIYPSRIRWEDPWNSTVARGDVGIVRTRLLETAGLFGVGASTASAIMANSVRSRNPIPIDRAVKGAVYGVAVRREGAKWFPQIKRVFTTTSDVDEREHCMSALARTEDGSFLTAVLEMTLSDTVRAQDVNRFIELVAANSFQSRARAWQFVRTKMNELLPRLGGLGGADSRVGPLVASVLRDFFGTSKINRELDIFVRDFSKYFAEGEVDAIKEMLQVNNQWSQKNAQETCDYFLNPPALL